MFAKAVQGLQSREWGNRVGRGTARTWVMDFLCSFALGAGSIAQVYEPSPGLKFKPAAALSWKVVNFNLEVAISYG